MAPKRRFRALPTRLGSFSRAVGARAPGADITFGAGANPSTQIVVTTQPSAAPSSGVAFATQPAVQLRDVGGVNVSEAGITITAYLVSGSGTLGGTLTATTNAGGLATFSNLSITGTGAHVLGFHVLLSTVHTIWTDDAETDLSGSYFEVDAAGGRFARATDATHSSVGWRSTYQSGTQVSHGSLHLAFGRTPDSYFAPVYGSTLDFGEVTAEFTLRHTIANPWTDKCYRCHVFSAADFSQAAQMHAWAETTTQLHLDPASGTDAGGTVVTSGYNDFANLTFLGAVAGTAAPFGATAATRKHFKIVTRLDAPGLGDGFMRQYIDGVLDAQATGLALVKRYTGYGINAAYFENFTNLPQAQTYDRYFDNIVVTGRARAVTSAASVTVTAGGGVGGLNEPSGYVQFTSQPFTSLPSNSWIVDIGTAAFATDATAPVSPSSVLRQTYPAGLSAGGGSTFKVQRSGPGTTALYINYAFKHSSNFQGENSGTNKQVFVWIHNTGAFFISSEGTGSGDLIIHGRVQDTPGASDTHYPPNVGPSGVVARGQWHQLEIQMLANTPGTANGTLRMWLDGVKTHEYTNVIYAGAGQSNHFDELHVYPIWGGTSGTVTNTMTLDFDHFYASTP